MTRTAAYIAKYGEEAGKVILRLIATIAANKRWAK
jgi:hypothetical protein